MSVTQCVDVRWKWLKQQVYQQTKAKANRGAAVNATLALYIKRYQYRNNLKTELWDELPLAFQ